jgi:hypothetical protein
MSPANFLGIWLSNFGKATSPRARGAAGYSCADGRRHGKVERFSKPIADTSGAVARPYRAIDTLAAMERRGTITAGMRQAGERFRSLFRIAGLDPLRAASLVRTSLGNRGGDPTARVLAAKEKLWRAICAVGGLASAGGACLWHVVGLEQTLKEWALTGGWCGRPIGEERASGILIAALGALEVYFAGPRSR